MSVVFLQTIISRVLSACSVGNTFRIQSSCLRSSRGLTMSSAKKSKTDDCSPSSHDQKRDRLVWIDLEMTGLDVEKEKIIEIACIVTSGNLDIIAEGPNIVIHQPKEVMDAMGDWCQQHHGQSGLTKAVLESEVSVGQAEDRVLSFLQGHTEAGCSPLAGNSVHMDRVFLQRYMPRLTHHLHYRILDVSSVKELCRRWYPAEFESQPQKALTHRALDDIRESIKELQYYRKAIFKS